MFTPINNSRPEAPEIELIIIGRIFTGVLVLLSLCWIPVIAEKQDGRLFDYIQAMTSYLSPPVSAVFLLAIFWPRCNEPGAFWGLVVGQAVGLIRFACTKRTT